MTGLLDQARVRVLLVPIMPVPSSAEHVASFQRYARQLVAHSAVRVADLKAGAYTSSSSSSSGPTGSRWNEGKVRFNFVTELPREHEYLDEFQPYRQVLGVIGVACCSDFANLDEIHKEFQTSTKDFSRSVVRRCVAFEPRDDQRTHDLDGVTVIPRHGEIDTYLERFMQEFGQLLLDAFGIMIAAIERRTIISTPDVGRPATPTNNTSNNPGGSTTGGGGGQPGQPPTSMNAQLQQTASSYFRTGSPAGSMTGTSAASGGGGSAATNEAKARKRTPGRAQKLIGDLLVLSGRLPDAVVAPAIAYRGTRRGPAAFVECGHGHVVWLHVRSGGAYGGHVDGHAAQVPGRDSDAVPRDRHHVRAGAGVAGGIAFGTVAADLLGEAGALRKRAFWLRRVTTQLFPLLHQTAMREDMSRKEIKQQLIACLNSVCPAYGIENYTPAAADVRVACEEEQLDPSGAFGWAVLQVDVLRECIRVCEIVRDYDRMVHYATQLLRRRRDYLHRDDQARIAGSLHRMVAHATSIGVRKQFNGLFWHNGFLRHLEACKPLEHRRPHLRKRRLHSGTETGTDPFIYNPFAKKTGEDTRKMIWVVNEPVYTMVTLWNPFAFDLELQEIRLITDGVAFESESAAALIPAGAPLTLRISGTPKEAGQLSIRGCSVVVFGGVYEEFYLRSPCDEEGGGDDSDGSRRVQATERQKTQLAIRQRPKHRQYMHTQWTRSIQAVDRRGCRHKDDANHRLLTSTTMTITLENIGREAVNFIMPTFTENPTPPPTGNHQLRPSKEDTYEQDRFLAYTHAFQWPLDAAAGEDSTCVTIMPGSTYDLTVGLYGKRNSTGGSIQIDYGHEQQCDEAAEDGNTPSDIVYTRQLSVPVLLTVRRTLELLNADVLMVNQRDVCLSEAEAMSMINQMIEHHRDQWCLLTLDVRNIWSTPFHLQFSLKQPSHTTATSDADEADAAIAHTSVMIQPGAAKRILLPVERLALRDEAQQPIPLVNKQFVVDKGPKLEAKFAPKSRRGAWPNG
ncbi:TRAPP II complex [Syncephalis pseudoplumigaleata]|uniref:TRAPP II complex n=1 Tax=Syncephalis pseudoplumigaleata TaxID=1712513 RepID=A0A4P9YY46_9FUNG|nr:TRAPP II complex [Syncephalis pseudoplumigaleata]|eukprot:RKP24868.1 TRAPP II complex [Syncephalis pseudoplumigaleata]